MTNHRGDEKEQKTFFPIKRDNLNPIFSYGIQFQGLKEIICKHT